MTTEELARTLREIEVKEMSEDTFTFLKADSYDELPIDLQDMYMKLAVAYQKYFDMERKTT